MNYSEEDRRMAEECCDAICKEFSEYDFGSCFGLKQIILETVIKKNEELENKLNTLLPREQRRLTASEILISKEYTPKIQRLEEMLARCLANYGYCIHEMNKEGIATIAGMSQLLERMQNETDHEVFIKYHHAFLNDARELVKGLE